MLKANKNRFVPFFLSCGVVVGILLGSFFANHFAGKRLSIVNNSSNKVIDLFHLIDDQYVDSVNLTDLVEKALPKILKELDPHSTYISAAEVEQSMQEALYATGGTAQSGDEFHRTFGSVDSVRRVYEKQSAQDDRRYTYYYIYTLGVCHLSVLLYIIALHIPAMK